MYRFQEKSSRNQDFKFMDFFDELIAQLQKEAKKGKTFTVDPEIWESFLNPAGTAVKTEQPSVKNKQPIQQSPVESTPQIQQPQIAVSGFFDIESLNKNILSCAECPLVKVRKNPALSSGDPQAKLMIVIENPSLLDDEEGTVFSGEVGVLLDKMLLAMGLERRQCYITSIVKCRTPGNRQLTADEVSKCSEKFFLSEVRNVRPECILAFGAGFAKNILHREGAISALRGTFDSYDGIPVMSTFNPAYLLRQPSAKKTVWTDLQMVMKAIGLK